MAVKKMVTEEKQENKLPYVSPAIVYEGLIKDMALELDKKGNVAVNNFQTSNPQVFAAGDTMCGPSLVVHAIDTGRRAAAAIDKYLHKSK